MAKNELSFNDLARINRIRSLTERRGRGISTGMLPLARAQAAAEQIEDLPSPQDINVVLSENVQRGATGGRGYTGRYAQKGAMSPFEKLTSTIQQEQTQSSIPTPSRNLEGGGGDATGHKGPGTSTGTFGPASLRSAVTDVTKLGLVNYGAPITSALAKVGTTALSPIAKALASFGIPAFGFQALNNLIGASLSEDAVSDAVDSINSDPSLTDAEKTNLAKAIQASVTQRSALGHLSGVLGFGDTASAEAAAAEAEGRGAPAGVGPLGTPGSFGPPNARTGLQSFSVADMLAQDAARPDIAAEIPLGTTETGFHGIIGEAEQGHLGIGKIGDIHGYGDVASHGLQGHRGDYGNIGGGGGGSGSSGGGTAGSASGDAGCFREDTNILMADLTLKPISDIKLGDMVMSFDDKNVGGELVPNKVVETFIHHGHKLINLNGRHVTKEHRIATDKGWKSVSDIELGDRIIMQTGVEMMVEIKTPVDNLHTVYNFTVENNHTYVADGMRVHNMKQKGGLITDGDPSTSGGPVWQYYHEDEYVLPKGITSEIGVDALEALRSGDVSAKDVGKFIRTKATNQTLTPERKQEQRSSMKNRNSAQRNRIINKLMRLRELGYNTTGMAWQPTNNLELENRIDRLIKRLSNNVH